MRFLTYISEIKYWLLGLYLRASQGQAAEALGTLPSRDAEQAASLASERHNHESDWLKSELRKVPYWARGHLLVGERSLAQEDIATAYASAQAVLQLKQSKLTRSGKLLLSRCYLKRGAFEQAKEILEELHTLYPADYEINEELAACYLPLSNHAKVVELLASIPEAKLSQPAKSALYFSRQK